MNLLTLYRKAHLLAVSLDGDFNRGARFSTNFPRYLLKVFCGRCIDLLSIHRHKYITLLQPRFLRRRIIIHLRDDRLPIAVKGGQHPNANISAFQAFIIALFFFYIHIGAIRIPQRKHGAVQNALFDLLLRNILIIIVLDQACDLRQLFILSAAAAPNPKSCATSQQRRQAPGHYQQRAMVFS